MVFSQLGPIPNLRFKHSYHLNELPKLRKSYNHKLDHQNSDILCLLGWDLLQLP